MQFLYVKIFWCKALWSIQRIHILLMQKLLSWFRIYPSWQTHLKVPSVFSHRPFAQMPGISVHSSKSREKKYKRIVCMNRWKPRVQNTQMMKIIGYMGIRLMEARQGKRTWDLPSGWLHRVTIYRVGCAGVIFWTALFTVSCSHLHHNIIQFRAKATK